MQQMKEIVSKYIHRFVSSEIVRPTLGRWNVQHNTEMIHFKVDQANTDHSCCTLHDFQKQNDEKDNLLHYYL
jgi:hypothetical protein